MIEGGHIGELDPVEQCPSGELRVDVDAQHDGVDEHADELVERPVSASRNRCRDGDLGGRRQTCEHRGHRRVDHHEECRALFGGAASKPRDHRRRQRPPHGRRACIGREGTRTVHRQRQHVRQSPELLRPVGQLARHLRIRVVWFAQSMTLPHRVIRVLQRQREPSGRAVGATRVVGLGHLAGEDRCRLAVGGDVMERDQENVVDAGRTEDPRTQRQVAGHVEGLRDGRGDLLGDHAVRLRDPRDDGVPDRDEVGVILEHDLKGFGGVTRIGARRVDRAEHFVPLGDVVDRAVHRVHVEFAVKSYDDGDHVCGGPRVELVEEPHPPLGVGQRDLLGPGQDTGHGTRCAAVEFAGVDRRREGLDRRRVEDHPHPDLDTEFGAEPCDDARRGQRGAAEVEERVECGHARCVVGAVHAEDLGEDRGDRAFGRGARFDVDAAGELGCRQRGAVEFAGGGEGDLVERDDRGRHHVRGQLPCGMGCQRRHVDDRTFAVVNPRHQHGLARRRVGDTGGGREVDRCMTFQHGVDLARLDPESADLDLEVAATEEVELPAAVPATAADEVTGPVHPLARSPERRGDEPLCGQGGVVQVSGGQRRTDEVQLARDAGWHRMQAGVEDQHTDSRDRSADRDGPAGTHGAGRGRPDGGLGRTVQVVHDASVRPGADEFGRAGVAGHAHHAEIGERLDGNRGQRTRCDRHVRDGLVGDDCRQLPATGDARWHHDQGRGRGHRDQGLEHGGVEPRCGETQYPRRRAQLETRPGVGDEIAEPAVRHRDALGTTGRARGEDDVGRVVHPDGRQRIVGHARPRRASRAVRQVEKILDDEPGGADVRLARCAGTADGIRRRARHAERRGQCAGHVPDPFGRLRRVDQSGRRPGPGDRPEGHRADRRAGHGQCHDRARSCTPRPEFRGEQSRRRIEFGVGQRVFTVGDGDTVRMMGHRGVEQRGQRDRRIREGRRPHECRDVVGLAGRQVTDRGLRCVDDRPRDGLQAMQQVGDGVRVEQCCRVGDHDGRVLVARPPRWVDDRHLQIHLGGGDRYLELGDDQSG
ncbi:hypothetical protein BPODLACK_03286 [Gordonia sp. YY1]|nr:hypothetical protein BPODLACK_03286 [Gordonia sp. YY1]